MRRMSRVISKGRKTRAASASLISSAARRGCGSSPIGSGGSAIRAGSASRSKRTESSAAPDMPSTVEWCILAMTAIRPPLQPLDDPDLPQRLGAVELAAGDVAGQVGQLPQAARAGDGGAPDVVVDVEVGVVDPDRVAQPEGDLDQPPAEDRGLGVREAIWRLHLGERVARRARWTGRRP